MPSARTHTKLTCAVAATVAAAAHLRNKGLLVVIAEGLWSLLLLSGQLSHEMLQCGSGSKSLGECLTCAAETLGCQSE